MHMHAHGQKQTVPCNSTARNRLSRATPHLLTAAGKQHRSTNKPHGHLHTQSRAQRHNGAQSRALGRGQQLPRCIRAGLAIRPAAHCPSATTAATAPLTHVGSHH